MNPLFTSEIFAYHGHSGTRISDGPLMLSPSLSSMSGLMMGFSGEASGSHGPNDRAAVPGAHPAGHGAAGWAVLRIPAIRASRVKVTFQLCPIGK